MAYGQWRNRRGGRGGRVPPPRLLTGKFLLTYREKRGKEKREKGRKLRRKGGKLGMEAGKRQKKRWGPFFFFFCFSLLKTTKICFGSTKMGIFYREKAFHGKKFWKNDFAPSEKYACYAPAYGLKACSCHPLNDMLFWKPYLSTCRTEKMLNILNWVNLGHF